MNDVQVQHAISLALILMKMFWYVKLKCVVSQEKKKSCSVLQKPTYN